MAQTKDNMNYQQTNIFFPIGTLLYSTEWKEVCCILLNKTFCIYSDTEYKCLIIKQMDDHALFDWTIR